jgi:hypothetical protein
LFRLANPGEFFREYSGSPKLKFGLAWLMIVGLVVPIAILMSVGLSERYAVYLVLVGIVPFQYVAYCILRSRRREQALSRAAADALREIFANQNLWLATDAEWTQALREKLTPHAWQRAVTRYTDDVLWQSLVLQSPHGGVAETVSSKLVLLFNAKEFSESFMRETVPTEYISRVQSRGLKKPGWRASGESRTSEIESRAKQVSTGEDGFSLLEVGPESVQQTIGR